MRSPSDEDARKIGNEPSSPVGRDPSYPDRARIDSDVRAFLRPASSPWIVFDRDSKVDDFAKSALRLGAVFASSPGLRQPSTVKLPQPTIVEAPMFPVSATPAAPAVEPSTVVLATDVVPETARTRSVFSIPDGLVRKRPSRAIVAAAVGVVLGVTALVAFRPSPPKATAVASAPPPVVVAPPPAVVEPAPAVEAAPPVEVTKPAEAEPKKKVLGKLTIKSDPKTKNVWMDGKRMLGVGYRTFLVACGMHTIAVNDKADAKDVEIPCNGEYAIGK